MRSLPLLLIAAILMTPACRRRSSGDDDDTPSDDDNTADDDDTADDDTVPGDDDTPAGDDDTTAGDDDATAADDDSTGDDDATGDPFIPCAQDLLSFIQNSGALSATELIGTGASQQLYSCETYQLQDVAFNSTNTPFTTSGNVPAWSLAAYPSVRLADVATPAHLILTGCAPYVCTLWTNTITVNVTTSLLMTEVIDGAGQHAIDVIFGTPSHDLNSHLLNNFQVGDCSLGNLNEDLQANGVDIFSILVPDVTGLFAGAITSHLAEVEAAAEAQSVLCWP